MVSKESRDRHDRTWYMSFRFTNDILTIEAICLSRRILESNCTPIFLKESSGIMIPPTPYKEFYKWKVLRTDKHHFCFAIINFLEIHSEPVASMRNNRFQSNISYVSFRAIKTMYNWLWSAWNSYDTAWSVIHFEVVAS